MMLFMVLVVVLPRLVLVLFDTWRIRRFHNHVLIDLDDPYFADILVQCAEDAALGRLIIVTSTIERGAARADGHARAPLLGAGSRFGRRRNGTLTTRRRPLPPSTAENVEPLWRSGLMPCRRPKSTRTVL